MSNSALTSAGEWMVPTCAHNNKQHRTQHENIIKRETYHTPSRASTLHHEQLCRWDSECWLVPVGPYPGNPMKAEHADA
jgi:hypothetical protein